MTKIPLFFGGGDLSFHREYTYCHFWAVGTKMGHETEGVGPKRALLGAPGVPQRSLKRPEHTIWMLPTQLDQPVAVGTKSGSFVPSEDLQGPLRTSRAPKRAFLGL